MEIIRALLIDLFQHLLIVLIKIFDKWQRSFTLVEAANARRLKELRSSICPTGVKYLVVIVSELNMSPYFDRGLAYFVRWLIRLLKTFKTIKSIITFLETHDRSFLSNIVVAVNILSSSLQHENVICVFFRT